MINLKQKILYFFCLALLLFVGVGIGFIKSSSEGTGIDNNSLLDYAKNYALVTTTNNKVVTASTKTYDVTVIYEDYYTVCKEYVRKSSINYGTTLDEVKEKEKKYQEENGLVYEILSESDDKIVYSRNIKENCPNHFKIVSESGKIVVYSIQGENKKTVFMTLDNINVDHLRDEIKEKVESGTYINSKEELNKFIEDLES